MKDKTSKDLSDFFCWNKECEHYKKRDNGNIKPSHYSGKDKDILILKCTTCGKRFSENKGTMFFRKHTKKDTIIKALKSTSEGTGIRATARIFDVNKNTVLSWVNEGGKHSEELEKKFLQFEHE